MSSKKQFGSTGNAWVIASLTIAASAALMYAHEHHTQLLQPYLPSTPAETKPYGSFKEFYPFYLGEHSEQWTRRLHFVGTALAFVFFFSHTGLALAISATVAVGLAVFPFFRHVPTGIPEFACMIATYIITARAGGVTLQRILVPLVVAYGLAWTGHFFVEHNKPATFIYPVYSLLGDWTMMYQMATGALAL